MRTVLLTPSLHGDGGIPRLSRLYLRALCESARAADRVDVVALNDDQAAPARLGSYSNQYLDRFIPCGKSRSAFLRSAWMLGSRADRVVCAHLHQLPLVWLLTAFRPQLRYVLIAHGIEVWRPYSAIEARSLKHAERILCVSEYTRRQLLRFCPELDAARTVVVPNPLDPALAAPSPATESPATESPATESPAAPRARSSRAPVVLCVSRLDAKNQDKGVDTVIEAFPRVLLAFPDATLRIVGDGDDLPRLRSLATARNASHAVTFTGALEDDALGREYAECDVFALPSRSEGFGLVYLEAMAHGKPCLAAAAGGAPEVVTDDVGALVAYGDVPAISDALVALLTHPPNPQAIARHLDQFRYEKFVTRLAHALGTGLD